MRSHGRVLLVSNSTVYGRGYLDHVETEIRSFLGSAQRVLFFPFALYDRDAYMATAKSRFDAIGLVPFQISTHYLDPDPNSTHMGETQEERILQFLEENDTPVVGMREGAWLLVEGCSVMLKGLTGARIFRRGQPPVEAVPI